MSKYEDKSLQYNKKYLRKAKFEFLERLYFYIIPTAQKRVKWLKKKKKFALLGEHVHYQPRKYPADGKRLKIHDNVAIAADVEFTLHDIIHWIYDGMEGKRCYKEYRGCVEIFENVFIGAGSRILPNVKIGPNVIIAAGSLVNKDVPPNTIVGGVPAKVIGNFDSLKEKRKNYNNKVSKISMGELNDFLWNDFYEERGLNEQNKY